MSGQPYGCRSVFPVCTCVGKRIDIDSADSSVLHRSDADRNFHLMTRGGCCLAFPAGEDHFGRLSGLPCHKRRKYFRHNTLLRSETAADPWLGNTDL